MYRPDDDGRRHTLNLLYYRPPKVSVFLALVTGLVTDLDSLVTDPVLALALRNRMYLSGGLVM